MNIEQIIESNTASIKREAAHCAENEASEIRYFLATGCGIISDSIRKILRHNKFKTAIKKPSFLTMLSVQNTGKKVFYKGSKSGYSHTYSEYRLYVAQAKKTALGWEWSTDVAQGITGKNAAATLATHAAAAGWTLGEQPVPHWYFAQLGERPEPGGKELFYQTANLDGKTALVGYIARRGKVDFHAATAADACTGLEVKIEKLAAARAAAPAKKLAPVTAAGLRDKFGFCQQGIETTARELGLDIAGTYTRGEVLAAARGKVLSHAADFAAFRRG